MMMMIIFAASLESLVTTTPSMPRFLRPPLHAMDRSMEVSPSQSVCNIFNCTVHSMAIHWSWARSEFYESIRLTVPRSSQLVKYCTKNISPLTRRDAILTDWQMRGRSDGSCWYSCWSKTESQQFRHCLVLRALWQGRPQTSQTVCIFNYRARDLLINPSPRPATETHYKMIVFILCLAISFLLNNTPCKDCLYIICFVCVRLGTTKDNGLDETNVYWHE